MDKLFDVFDSFGLFKIISIFIIITIHSFTKAAISLALGDKLPKKTGRFTLNPFKHFDWIGFLMFFFTGFGWDKPVKTSSMLYKDKKVGAILVNVIPIAVCIVFAFIVMQLQKIALGVVPGVGGLFLIYFCLNLSTLSLAFAVFNIIPIYPLDGSGILRAFLSPNAALNYTRMEGTLQLLLVFAVMFNIMNYIIEPIVSLLYRIFNII